MQTVYDDGRVRLRPFTSREEGEALAQEIHLALIPGWGEQWVPPRRAARYWDDTGWLDHEKYIFAIERLDTGELAGYELATPPHAPRLGGLIATYIREAHQRQGIGVAAKLLAMSLLFENYPCQVVEAITLCNHPRALRGLELCGMREAGRLRGCTVSEGRWVDKVFFVITREEWQALPVRGMLKRG